MALNASTQFYNWWRFAKGEKRAETRDLWNRVSIFHLVHGKWGIDDQLESLPLTSYPLLSNDNWFPYRVLITLNNPWERHPRMPPEILKVLEDYQGPDMPDDPLLIHGTANHLFLNDDKLNYPKTPKLTANSGNLRDRS